MTTPAKTMNGNATEWKEELGGQLEEVKENLTNASDMVLGFIKEKPVLCVLGALAAGYVFGRIVRR